MNVGAAHGPLAKNSAASDARSEGMPATPLARAQQDVAMTIARDSGAPWAEVASTFGLSLSQAQRRVQAHRKNVASQQPSGAAAPTRAAAELFDIDGLQVVADLEAALTRAFTRFEQIATTSAHDGYRIAATRQELEWRFAHLNLLRQVGIAPRELGLWKSRRRLEDAAYGLGQIIARHNLPDAVLREFLELTQQIGGPEPTGLPTQTPADRNNTADEAI